MTRLVALSLSSAALLSVAHRPWPGTGYLALIALLPLLLALDGEKRWTRGALAGWLAALGTGVVGFEGVAPAEFWAYPVLVAIAGIPWAIAGAVYVLVARRSCDLGPWFLVPLLLAAEFVPAQRLIFGDFANGMSAVGYTQFDTPLLSVAGWSGVTGVSLLVIGLNVAVHAALSRRVVPLAGWLVVTLLLVVVPVPGSGSRSAGGSELRVGVVQGAVASIDTLLARFDREAAARMLEPYADLTAQAAQHGVDLVVWGETVIPQAVRQGHVPDYVADALGPAPVALVGGVAFDGSATYNSIFHWAEGDLTEVYRKRALVPFNERHYTAGPALPPLDVNGMRVGMGVCLDSIFSGFARESVRAGAEALVYVTEDSFAIRTVMPELHLRVTAFRAAETGRYVVFANQSGPSAVFDNRGRVVEHIRHGEAAAIVTSLPAFEGATPFAILGDWVGVLSLLLPPVALLLRGRKSKPTGAN